MILTINGALDKPADRPEEIPFEGTKAAKSAMATRCKDNDTAKMISQRILLTNTPKAAPIIPKVQEMIGIALRLNNLNSE